ncbi:hypothetical protein K2F54_04425 [Cryobacterium sp. 1639]|uniref:hypothetical protein n=1 Tax=Cryobacterium inferilacus TaxID=2866629 RepID=UPI001C72CBF3|nr:hypothetical protein [Cryobacterium sp. 1639]MBX0299220.1 hypothetical protein [Cryobacterium sp. 1639]
MLDLQPQLSRAVDLVQQAVGESGMSAAANVFTVTVEIELYPDAGDADPVVLDGAALHALEDDIRAVLYPGFDVEITQVGGVQIGF